MGRPSCGQVEEDLSCVDLVLLEDPWDLQVPVPSSACAGSLDRSDPCQVGTWASFLGQVDLPSCVEVGLRHPCCFCQEDWQTYEGTLNLVDPEDGCHIEAVSASTELYLVLKP